MKKFLFFIFISTFYNLFPAATSSPSTPTLAKIYVTDGTSNTVSEFKINHSATVNDFKNELSNYYQTVIKVIEPRINPDNIEITAQDIFTKQKQNLNDKDLLKNYTNPNILLIVSTKN